MITKQPKRVCVILNFIYNIMSFQVWRSHGHSCDRNHFSAFCYLNFAKSRVRL